GQAFPLEGRQAARFGALGQAERDEQAVLAGARRLAGRMVAVTLAALGARRRGRLVLGLAVAGAAGGDSLDQHVLGAVGSLGLVAVDAGRRAPADAGVGRNAVVEVAI